MKKKLLITLLTLTLTITLASCQSPEDPTTQAGIQTQSQESTTESLEMAKKDDAESSAPSKEESSTSMEETESSENKEESGSSSEEESNTSSKEAESAESSTEQAPVVSAKPESSKAPESTPSPTVSTAPSKEPSTTPSAAPSKSPEATKAPASQPTTQPSSAPTQAPSTAPTTVPTPAPTTAPTAAPTATPAPENTHTHNFELQYVTRNIDLGNCMVDAGTMWICYGCGEQEERFERMKMHSWHTESKIVTNIPPTCTEPGVWETWHHDWCECGEHDDEWTTREENPAGGHIEGYKKYTTEIMFDENGNGLAHWYIRCARSGCDYLFSEGWD